jgi:hypothetical protein
MTTPAPDPDVKLSTVEGAVGDSLAASEQNLNSELAAEGSMGSMGVADMIKIQYDMANYTEAGQTLSAIMKDMSDTVLARRAGHRQDGSAYVAPPRSHRAGLHATRHLMPGSLVPISFFGLGPAGRQPGQPEHGQVTLASLPDVNKPYSVKAGAQREKDSYSHRIISSRTYGPGGADRPSIASATGLRS